MTKHPQTADDEVEEVIKELKVHHHGFITSCEGSSVSNKTYHEDYFITNLEDKIQSHNVKDTAGLCPEMSSVFGCWLTFRDKIAVTDMYMLSYF